MIDLTSNTFNEYIQSADKPVLVDFWADWCTPCKAMAPILDEVNAETDDLTVVKVDADENIDLCKQYGVMSMPTLILFKDGEPVGSLVGARSKERLLQELSTHI